MPDAEMRRRDQALYARRPIHLLVRDVSEVTLLRAYFLMQTSRSTASFASAF